ncbi:MAG: DedA family protein [Bacteroidales bacterium]|nr:DedA family protein [Bacteroidales bacterium]
MGLFIGCLLSATVVPFSSDALYVGILLASKQPLACLVVGTAGNWIGGVITYFLGRLAKWEWIEKAFRVSHEKLEKQKPVIEKWGIWIALLSWIPFIGDVFVIALGFYRTPAVWTILLLLVGKFLRSAVWTLILL